MKWLFYLRLALIIISIIKDCTEGKKVNAANVITAIEPILPVKLKGNLKLLTPTDIEGIQDAFLTIGDLVNNKENND